VLLDREDEQRVSGASTNARHLTRFSYDTLLRCKREDCRTWLDARWTVHIHVVIAQERFTYPTEIVKPPNRTLVEVGGETLTNLVLSTGQEPPGRGLLGMPEVELAHQYALVRDL
jgi:hypothetical protein